jgi:hypothetical protein
MNTWKSHPSARAAPNDVGAAPYFRHRGSPLLNKAARQCGGRGVWALQPSFGRSARDAFSAAARGRGIRCGAARRTAFGVGARHAVPLLVRPVPSQGKGPNPARLLARPPLILSADGRGGWFRNSREHHKENPEIRLRESLMRGAGCAVGSLAHRAPFGRVSRPWPDLRGWRTSSVPPRSGTGNPVSS